MYNLNSRIRAYQRYLQNSINDFQKKKQLYENAPLFGAEFTSEDQLALDIYEFCLSQFNCIFIDEDEI
jgi:hypothetical protein